MADLLSPLEGNDVRQLVAQLQKTLEDFAQERIGGLYVGDVFSAGSDDILTLEISSGLEKSAGALLVKLLATGGLQFSSGSISVKCKAGGGLTTSADGLESSGLAFFSFKTVHPSSGDDLVADAAADTLNLTGGTGITVTGTAASDTATIAVKQQAHEADASTSHAITDPADSPASADALRDDLVTNTIPAIETALNALGTKVNNILSKLESAEILAAP